MAYEPKSWVTGDIIKALHLNNIEQTLADLDRQVGELEMIDTEGSYTEFFVDNNGHLILQRMNEEGQELVQKDLGPVSAYAQAKAHGYDKTADEFGEEQTRLAEAMEQSASDRERAETAANQAENNKDLAVAAATEATTAANNVGDVAEIQEMVGESVFQLANE